MFTDIYLYIEDMKERMDDPNRYNDILRLEQELTEMAIMSEFSQEEMNELPF